MAARWEKREAETDECANCGTTEDLLRCSRCRAAWFCSHKCQKSYWPFHRSSCRKNEFADAIEESEPKFAAWMRGHGKLAVLKDDEVERLERAALSTSVGAGRAEMMDSMYGRIEPKPQAPSFTPEEEAAMEVKRRAEARQALLLGDGEREWLALPAVPCGLGQDGPRHKWLQNQSHVELYVRLPAGRRPKAVSVSLQTRSLSVTCSGDVLLAGQLYKEVKAELSTWYIDGDVLHVQLLKRNRRGHYEGSSGNNADTFWYALLADGPAEALLPGQFPPTSYYSTRYEEDDLPPPVAPRRLLAGRTPPAAGALAA